MGGNAHETRSTTNRGGALPSFLADAPLAAAVLTPFGQVDDANDSFARITGRPLDDVRGAHARDLFRDAWPRVEAALRWVTLTHTSVPELEITGRSQTEPTEERHWLVGMFPATPGDAAHIGVTIVDITTREQARGYIRVLARASSLFASAVDYDDALDRAARIAVPEFADACLLHANHDDSRRRAAIAGVESAITARLFAGGRDHGAISFLRTSRSGRRYRPEEVDLAREIGRRIAQTLDNFRFRAEAERARGRLDVLARVGELLAVELNVQQRLRDVSRLMLPDLGDAAGVYLLDGDRLRLVSVGHHDAEIDESLQDVRLPSYDIAAPLPPCEAVRTRRTVVATDVHPDVLHAMAGRRGAPPDVSLPSLVCVPLVVDEEAIGALALAWHRTELRHDLDDVTLVNEVARRIAPALDQARRYERDREIVEMLQRSLLPAALPDVPGITIAGRYVPGTEGLRIGGDWYDALVMPDGRLFLAIGDVVGHGIRAASAMGRMRVALQVYALEGLSPAAMLDRLNRHFAGIAEADMATLAVLLLDPSTGEVEMASAGHPPLAVRSPDGAVTLVDAGTGPPVCALKRARFRPQLHRFDPGTTIVLYTDGLVERRGEPLDAGLDRLADELATGTGDAATLADRLLDSQPLGSDDVALLVVHIEREVAPLSLELGAHPRELASMRHALAQWLARAGAPATLRDDAVLAVNEAVANSIAHAYGPVDAAIVVSARTTDESIDLSVRDFGAWRPPRDVGGGRGLALIEKLVDGVEIATGADGTEVRMRVELAREVTV